MLRCRRSRTLDGGFTLIEVMVTCVLLSAMLAISAPAIVNWSAARAQKDTARELVSQLRSAQVRAQSEVTPYRVDISASEIRTYRVVGATETLDRSHSLTNARVTFGTGVFTDSEGSGSRVWFFPRGNGSDGSVTVERDGTSKVYTVEVEGLTSRVTYTG